MRAVRRAPRHIRGEMDMSAFSHRVGRIIASSAFCLLFVAGLSGCDDNIINAVFRTCPPLNLVFVMDTSGSMDDDAAALCSDASGVQSEIEALGGTLSVTILGIDEDADDETEEYSCLSDNVVDLLGSAVPGGGILDDNEDWAPASAVIAANFPWDAGALRVVVPISDEGPSLGDPCTDPGSDRDAVDNAISVAQANNVILSPIAASESSQCVIDLGAAMAAGTGGTAFESEDPATDLAGGIFGIVEGACTTQ